MGVWLCGFQRRLGFCDTQHAEMWGVLIGLEITWRKGLRRVVVESDSKGVVDKLKSTPLSTNNPILLAVRTLMDRDLQICFVHVPRSTNTSADLLARSSLLLDTFNAVELNSPWGAWCFGSL